MGRSRFLFVLLLLVPDLPGQNRPVIEPRGVTNAFTLEPAPARVGLGGLVQITGLNLGPEGGAKASGTPWPAELGDVKLMIGGKQAPLYSVGPGKIMAQVPMDANTGLVDVVLERGGQRSTAARVYVDPLRPSVKTADGSGHGQPAGTLSGGILTMTATGLGRTGDDGMPAADISAWVGGLPAKASVAPADGRQGEFDVSIEIPGGAREGDLISVMAARQAANRTMFGSLAAPDVQALRLPDGAPQLTFLADTDLNGNFLMGNGARDDSGCYQAVLFDMAAGKAANVDGCLTAPNKNAATPLVVPNDGGAIGALVGPPQGEPPAGISSQVQIFSSAADPLKIDLAGAASQLMPGAAGNLNAVVPGTPAQVFTIDSQTGDVAQGGGGGGIGTLAGAGGGLMVNLHFDLDGLTHLLGVAQAGGNRVAILAGDDANQPTRAKFAMVNPASGDVLVSKDFPEGWLPALGPLPPARANAPAQTPGINLTAIRATFVYDATRQVFYALARNADARNAFVAFPANRADPTVIAFPDGWFAPTCSTIVRTASLELSRRLALVGTTVSETPAFNQACAGTGFLLLDLNRQQVSAVPVQAGSQIAANGMGEVNDYIYTTNIDPSRRGQTADTVYVLDGVTATAFTIGLPNGISGFETLRPIRDLSMLVGAATDTVQGDQGLVLFDLDQAVSRALPVPVDFTTVSELGVLVTTRKMIGRAMRTGASELVIYDLMMGDIIPVPNPQGIASIGPPPRQQQQTPAGPGTPQLPGGGQAAISRLMSVNQKANTVSAVGYNAAGRQVGVVVVRVP